MKSNLHRRGLSLLLAACMLLSCAACGGGTSAATMHLRKTEGTVGVSDDGGKEVEPKDNLGLYSGYGVDTKTGSYAWIDLDSVKLTKLDEESEIAIQKDGKELEIEVLSGNLFFRVTEPLADDETMTIRSSSMLVGIRGTCGWVAVSGDAMTLCLLEGKVECTAGENSETVNAGERAVMMEDGTITVSALQKDEIPDFVWDEVDDGLLDEAEEAMEEALERYPLSAFKSREDYMDASQLSSEIKETALEIYDICSAENWDRAFQLLLATRDSEEGIAYQDGAGRRFCTEYAGFRMWLIHSETGVTFDIRPKSGTGFHISWQIGDAQKMNCITAQCENYIRSGDFTSGRYESGIGYLRYQSGQLIEGMLDGEIISWDNFEVTSDGVLKREYYDKGVYIGPGGAGSADSGRVTVSVGLTVTFDDGAYERSWGD